MRNPLFEAKSKGGYVTTPVALILDTDVDEVFKAMDYSGSGMYHFWNKLSGTVFKMKKGKLDERTASELLFHGTFGSHKEDLSLLQYTTGHEFQTRKDIGDKLKARGQSTDLIDVKIIPYTKIGKLANAAQTDLLTGARGQLNRCPTFSIRCKQSVNLEGALYKTLARGPSGSLNAGKADQASLLARLASIKASIRARIEKEKVINWGTVDAYEYDVALKGVKYGKKIVGIPDLKGIYFYGIPDQVL